MATTLNIESFADINIKERSQLSQVATAGSDTIVVDSTNEYGVGDILYVGDLSREECEKVVIQSVDSPTGLTLVAPVKFDHARFEPVTSVVGDKIHIYRAPNVDGTVPADDAFNALAIRQINPEALSTYYVDSSGSSAYWYKFTYLNETSSDETALAESVAVRGDDYGHYASLTEIRKNAGFENNYNIKDSYLDQKRRAAESELNTSLSNNYTTPFSPVPDFINTMTIALAVGLIWEDQYGSNSQKAKGKLGEVRQMIKDLQSRTSDIVGMDGTSLAGQSVSFWPDETAPRAFEIGMKF